MHIGGMRTALFNWLWARHNGGQFILRIDDTDQQRNVDEALEPILNAFKWLGLDWDEGPECGGPNGPYFQSQRGDLYKQAVEKLIDEGKAYYCFDPPAVVQADREAAEKEKRNFLNIRRSLELSAEQVQQNLDEGKQHVIRLLVPRDQKISIVDHVRGDVEWDCGIIPDPVIFRSNGTPLYNFATVVDDSQMQISHVIRAEEHLSNTPVQVLIYEALGLSLPEFAHIPFVTAPGTSKKLSKRDVSKYRNNPKFRRMFESGDRTFEAIGLETSDSLNPVMVEYYERIGYLPAGVLNSLARLGWSLDDKTEIMSLEFVTEHFTLDRVVKAPAGLDPEKLASFQTHWMTELEVSKKVEMCIPYLLKAGILDAEPNEEQTKYLGEILAAMGDRLKVASDIIDYGDFFQTADEIVFDEKAFNKRLRKEGAAELLSKFRGRLAAVENFDVESLDKLMHDFVESEGIKIGDIIHAARVGVTGKGVGFGMFETLEVLGKDECLARIDRALSLVEE